RQGPLYILFAMHFRSGAPFGTRGQWKGLSLCYRGAGDQHRLCRSQRIMEADFAMSPLIRAVVTGGGGFLGSRIVSMLLDEGCAVMSFSRHHYPNLSARGVTCHVGDLADASAVSEALREAD